MPPLHPAQVAMPVRRMGPVTTRGGRIFGFLDLRDAWTASKVSASIIGSTATGT